MFYTIFGTAKDVSVGPTAVVSVEVLNFNPIYIIIFVNNYIKMRSLK